MVGLHWVDVAILASSTLAIFFSQSLVYRVRRFACFFGLAGQPFWIIQTWQAEQMGMFIVSIIFTLAWFKGFWVHWVKREVVQVKARVKPMIEQPTPERRCKW